MPDRIDQQLGNYRLLRKLGQGGFAEVYLGEHIHLGTQAAIKVLLPVEKTDVEIFRKEARTVANLIHPHIVRVLVFDIEDNNDTKTPFLVMDYAPSGTLRQRYPRGTCLDLTTIVSFVKQIAAGLQYAHNQNLVHRDIKPENLLVGRHSEILLSDFGIALIAQSSRYQSTQDVVGTVAYMSPEQIQGKPRSSSDQYSLGIVVYEWLTGDRPFHGSFTELCAQHMFASPPPLRGKEPRVSLAVENVVNTALAKDPKQRFVSVEAFANALEKVSSGKEPIIIIKPQSTPQISSSLPLTQAAVPPLLVPTQFANTSSIGVIPNEKLVTPRTFSEGREERSAAKIWGIGVRQMLCMALGAALYGGLSYILPPANSNVSFRPAIVIPLFFGAVFGPLVGLFTGGIGNFLGDYISGYGVYWNWDLGNALIGFVAGLAMYITWGRYNKVANIVTAEIFGIVGILIGIGFAAYSDIWVSKYNMTAATANFVPATVSDLVNGVILLPILLVAYNAATRRMGRS